MFSHHEILMIFALVLYLTISLLNSPATGENRIPFDSHYTVDYGQDHVQFLDSQKTLVQLSLDSDSGARFSSKVKYESGLFGIRIKFPPGNSAGVVTAFNLRSEDKEFDGINLEILGSNIGQNFSIQTNVFVNGVGNKQHEIALPFDASEEFHEYNILWNSHLILTYVDDIAFRIFKNNSAIGVGYPSKPMKIFASVSNGSDDLIRTDSGRSRTKIDWRDAPFAAQFKSLDYDVDQACISNSTTTTKHKEGRGDCGSTRKTGWDTIRDLPIGLIDWYEAMRHLITYDYCNDTKIHPLPPPECKSNIKYL
ncbi:OLC1v1006770C1 [Oldenlandia corymbosa var. corymbosa]|uniref:OLC1v1006770C1 n=1 Tax=Oldenlandia corymbosa var. corymbosa TaxID=529605 RepID=A0AAV1DI40_OLDCO|nr:OLC1v1006770C1 [Oldenlandia corymbosa var. corymbosa]